MNTSLFFHTATRYISLLIVMIMLMLFSSCKSTNDSEIAITTSALIGEVNEIPSKTPTTTPSPTLTSQPTFTIPFTPTFAPISTNTTTPTPTNTPLPTATPTPGPIVPDGWSIYEQIDGIYAIGYPPHWKESPFPFSLNADLTLFPINEPIFVKVEIAIVYDPSGITPEGVADAVGEGLSQDPNITFSPLEVIEISGRKGLTRRVELRVPGEEEPAILPGRHYYFVNNGFSFIITVLADGSVYNVYESDFDAIISTLYFPSDIQ